MKHLIGKSCKLTLEVNNKILYYTVKQVTDVTETHISFIDKFDDVWSFRIKDIVEANHVR